MPSLPLESLIGAAQEGLLLVVAVSLPVVGVTALVALLVSALQSATQIQDSTLSHLPRLLAVAVVLAVAGPWMGEQIAEFAVRVIAGG